MPERTYTITEAAKLVGLGPKAMRRRTERGSVRTLLEDRQGKPVKVISADELMRVGLLQVEPGQEAPEPPEPDHRPAPAPASVVDASYLVAELRELAGEVATRRLLEAQSGERERAERQAREQAEAELARARAAVRTAQEQAADERRQRQVAEEHAARLSVELAARDTPEPVEPAGPVDGPAERPGLWARLMGKMDPPR